MSFLITPHFNALVCETNKIIILYLLYLHTACTTKSNFLTDFFACILKAHKCKHDDLWLDTLLI